MIYFIAALTCLNFVLNMVILGYMIDNMEVKK